MERGFPRSRGMGSGQPRFALHHWSRGFWKIDLVALSQTVHPAGSRGTCAHRRGRAGRGRRNRAWFFSVSTARVVLMGRGNIEPSQRVAPTRHFGDRRSVHGTRRCVCGHGIGVAQTWPASGHALWRRAVDPVRGFAPAASRAAGKRNGRVPAGA